MINFCPNRNRNIATQIHLGILSRILSNYGELSFPTQEREPFHCRWQTPYVRFLSALLYIYLLLRLLTFIAVMSRVSQLLFGYRGVCGRTLNVIYKVYNVSAPESPESPAFVITKTPTADLQRYFAVGGKYLTADLIDIANLTSKTKAKVIARSSGWLFPLQRRIFAFHFISS